MIVRKIKALERSEEIFVAVQTQKSNNQIPGWLKFVLGIMKWP